MTETTSSARLHIGTYSGAGGAGLHALNQDPTGGWSLGDAYPGAPNASFGAYSRRFDLHYLVDEVTDGWLRVLRNDAGWQSLARVPTHGALPCYVSLDRDERWLAVANYGSGSLALFRLDPNTGLVGDPVALHENSGRGPVPDRQDGPHAHCAVFSPDGKWLYQTDLGTDEVLAFPFDPDRGLLGGCKLAFEAAKGSGPRHLVFHPHRPFALMVSELASTLTLLDVDEGGLSKRQTMSTLPSSFNGDSLGGHVATNAAGDRIYVTNRGHDSIATVALDESGRLSLIGHTPTGGASPRFFLLLEAERQMLVANEEGDNITIFDLAADGALAQFGDVAVAAPAFLFVAPKF
jgi:6-phosphogluconolactonase (cycloisomerase 2 family)